MSRIAYVNGAYVDLTSAAIGVEDRGFQFADGVYEVWSLYQGALLEEDAHLARLGRSLAELRIPMPMTPSALRSVIRETVRRNRLADGLVYLQVTRGVAPRDHGFPAAASPTVVVTARRTDVAALRRRARDGVAVVTMPDIRWGRCDIKSVSLLPNVLAKQQAREAGAYEAWLVDRDGHVTEGTSSTAWIVDADGRLRTRPLGPDILPGVTRAELLRLATERQMTVDERSFTVEEAKTAREAFMSAASGALTPIVSIDGAIIGEGRPGPAAVALREAYFSATTATAARLRGRVISR